MSNKGLIVAAGFSLFLNLTGLRWGIPSGEYKGFYPGRGETMSVVSGISPEYVKDSWQITRRGENLISRSVFNPIRSFHPDEHNIIKSISNMDPGRMDFNPHFFEYPSFFIYFTALILGLSSLAGLVKATPDISFYMLNPGEMGRFFMAGRAGVVFLSVMGIILLYKAAENFFDRKTAFLAALMMGITPLYVINSHYMTVDVPMVFWITACIYFLSLSWKSGRLSFFYMSAAAAGIAAGTKYPAASVCLILPLFYAVMKGRISGIFSRQALTSFILAGLFFLFTTPYSILSFPEFKRDLFYQVGIRGVGLGSSLAALAGFCRNTVAAAGSGFSILAVVFLAGAVRALFTGKKPKLFLAGLFFSLLPVILSGSTRYARYYLVALPFASILAALFIACILKGRPRSIAAGVFIALLMLFPLSKSLAYSFHMTREDVRIEAARYVVSDIAAGSRIIFTSDPWIFEVPPVNPNDYHVEVIGMGSGLSKAERGSFLIIGELQHYLGYGSRNDEESRLIGEIGTYGYSLEKRFKRSPGFFTLKFDSDNTIHDMVYTHPAIYIFRKT